MQLEQKFTQQLKYSEEVSSRKIHEITKANSDLKAENEKLEVSLLPPPPSSPDPQLNSHNMHSTYLVVTFNFLYVFKIYQVAQILLGRVSPF